MMSFQPLAFYSFLFSYPASFFFQALILPCWHIIYLVSLTAWLCPTRIKQHEDRTLVFFSAVYWHQGQQWACRRSQVFLKCMNEWMNEKTNKWMMKQTNTDWPTYEAYIWKRQRMLTKCETMNCYFMAIITGIFHLFLYWPKSKGCIWIQFLNFGVMLYGIGVLTSAPNISPDM